MKLIIFDIDGTILDSVNADDKCFIQTFKELYQIDLTNADWNDFKNVTDTGLTNEIFEKWLNRIPKKEEIETIKAHFKSLLNNCTHEFTEIENSLPFIKSLSNKPDFEIGFATGGWKETAELKCNSIGLNLNEFIFKSSNDHFNRAKIIELVINDALDKNNNEQFESILYFGDGLWDFKTTIELGIDFIGVDYKDNDKLHNIGVEKIINNYTESDKILNWIKEKTPGNTVYKT
jgi:phosphoglycolate phosphatase-like HAD superfamily hydrolase